MSAVATMNPKNRPNGWIGGINLLLRLVSLRATVGVLDRAGEPGEPPVKRKDDVAMAIHPSVAAVSSGWLPTSAAAAAPRADPLRGSAEARTRRRSSRGSRG
jgi:hypothetical protein